MEKQLELKHLSVYLPYGLKIYSTYWKESEKLHNLRSLYNSDYFGCNGYTSEFIKPILRPLSDFENFLDLNGDLCVDNISDYVFEIIEHINAGRRHISELVEIPYSEFEFLIKNHFDVFGLIESVLAIDINTLNTTENGSEILQPKI